MNRHQRASALGCLFLALAGPSLGLEVRGELYGGKKDNLYIDVGGVEVRIVGEKAEALASASGMRAVLRGKFEGSDFLVQEVVTPERRTSAVLPLAPSPEDQVEVEPRVTVDGQQLVAEGSPIHLLQRIAQGGTREVLADAWIGREDGKPAQVKVLSVRARARSELELTFSTPFPVEPQEEKVAVAKGATIEGLVTLTADDEGNDVALIRRDMAAPRDDWFHTAKVGLEALTFEAAEVQGITARLLPQ